jgi:hypothetical protein
MQKSDCISDRTSRSAESAISSMSPPRGAFDRSEQNAHRLGGRSGGAFKLPLQRGSSLTASSTHMTCGPRSGLTGAERPLPSPVPWDKRSPSTVPSRQRLSGR